MLLGLSVLIGWISHAAGFRGPVPELLTMHFSTALSLILCGVAVLCVQDDCPLARAYPIAMTCAAATAIIGFLTAAQYVFDWHPGLVPSLLRDRGVDGANIPSTQIGLNTALCLMAFGLALLLVDNRLVGPYPAQVLTMAATVGAFAALIGHAYSIESLYGISTYIPMALHSSIALILMGVGIFCARPEQGWMALLISDRMGSKVARRLLPAAILIPLVNGLLELRGERLGFYGAEFGAALVSTSNIVLLGALIWWTATSLNRVDQQRQVAERKRDLYQHMFVHSKDGIVVMDHQGHYIEQNPQHEQLLGYAFDDMRGRTPALILGESEFGRIAGELARQGMYRGEAMCRTKSGKELPFDLSTFSVRSEDGEIICYVCIKRDITDRKRSEHSLREAHDDLERRVLERTAALMDTNAALKIEIGERKRAEQALHDISVFTQSILDSLNVHIAVVNQEGAIVAVNEAWMDFARARGVWSDHAEMGMQYADICQKLTGQASAFAQSVADSIHKILGGAAAIEPCEYEYLCEAGTEQRWFLMTIVPYRGTHAGAVISHFDITARKQAEEALRESETRFRAIFNQASVGIAEVRPDGRFLWVNSKLSDIVRRPPDVLLNMTFQELTHPDDLPENLSLLQETLTGERHSCSIEKRYLRQDKTEIWCRLSVSLVRTATGAPKHFISVIEDVSEQKRTRDALQTIAAATAGATEVDFFRSLVPHLAAAMQAKYAFVAELIEGEPARVHTLAVWAERDYTENLYYDLKGTPCENMIGCRTCFYPRGVQKQFPADTMLAALKVESYYGMPLFDRAGTVLGLLGVMHDQPLTLLPGMEQMLVIFAARAGMELERKRTLEALRFSDQALRQLIQEREQLAQDLHDGIIQSIYAAGLGLEEARRLVEEKSPASVTQIQTVVGDLNSLIEDVRNHIVRKPREIKNGSQLKLALERLVRVLRTCPTIEIVAAIDRAAADLLLPAQATHVYYIAAEALSNAVRHSQARHCMMALRVVRGAVRLEVSDNGCGFDPSLSYHEGHGLRNLSGRATKLGTRLRVVSSTGGGTRMVIDLPKELKG